MVAPQMYFSMAGPSYQSPLRTGHCDFFEVFEDELDTSHLHARLVTPAARQRLLAHRYPWNLSHSGRRPDADTLLADLGRLAPSVAKDFVPKSSVEANLSFRLINDLTFQGEEDSYIALSYAWNKIDRHGPRKMVSPVGDLPFGWVRTVEQCPLPTSRGMFQAVLDERRPGEGLWFDQVCVNQEDETEKSIALGSMDTIYKNARTVVVALDDIAATGDELFFLEQYIQQHVFAESHINFHPNRGLNPPFTQQHPPFRSLIERILSSNWFDRAWCVHEMKMGFSHVFLVPCLADAEDESIYTVIRFTGVFFLHLLILANEDVLFPPSLRIQIRTLLEHFAHKSLLLEHDALARQSPTASRPSISEPASLIPTIAEIFRKKAGGNPRLPQYLKNLDANRDKTCMVLNIAGLPLARRAASPLQRPTIEDECLRQLLLVGLAACDPATLCTTGSPLQLHDGSISWLCRPTALDIPSTSAPPPPSFAEYKNTITHGSDGRAEYVQLDLVFVDLPHRSQPNPNFPAHITRARDLLDLCIQYQVQSHTLWNTCLGPDARGPAMRNMFIQTLACVLDCGAEWFIEATAHLPSSPNSTPLDTASLAPIFNAQILPLHIVQYPSALPTLSALLDTLSALITYGVPWASGATERTHGPMIVTSPSPSPLLSPPYSVSSQHSQSQSLSGQGSPHSPPGKALLFAPFAHSKTLLVAVPEVVKGDAFKALARGWILTTRNPYTGSPRGMVSWELKGKSALVGNAAFARGMEGCWESRNHRVYGPCVG